ncbi:MAG: ATP synthase F1 subunit gamma [Ignavibacteria bacterium]|nr:ATP synthase F1 subunit gamma [Ignavibacteria bacterium]MBK7412975.1 ATP synthase F1 subunit gamma [Ignavibacteria bacterium]
MATLRETRDRITSVKNTSKITQAMSMVATAKLRRAQDAIIAARPFAKQVQKILGNLSSADTEFVHPFFETRKTVTSIAIIVISSDRGLCGAFNTNLLRAAGLRMAELHKEHPAATIHVIPVGKRAVNSARKGSEDVVREFNDVFTKLDYSTAVDIAELVSDSFLAQRFDQVELMSNEFVTVMRQEVRRMQLLPIIPDVKPDKSQHNVEYIFEPTRAEILDTLLPMYVKLQVWRSLLDSNAAEHAARRMAMENATTNARDLIKSLQLIYNRERQAAITKEMLEIVGGAEALSGN